MYINIHILCTLAVKNWGLFCFPPGFQEPADPPDERHSRVTVCSVL